MIDLQTLGSPPGGEPKRGGAGGPVGSISSSAPACLPDVPEQQAAEVRPGGALSPVGTARICRSWACKVVGLTRVPIVEFVVQVAGNVPGHPLLDPVGVGIQVIAHEHAEEDHQGHLQEQADDRQPPAEIGVPGHAAGGAWPGRAAGSSDARRRERLLRLGQGRGGRVRLRNS